MIGVRYTAALILAFGLLSLCSCATRRSIPPAIPSEASFNDDAGHGRYLRLKLHLKGTKEVEFLVDTGSPATILPAEWESKLGERLGVAVMEASQRLTTNGVYEAPDLYLGDTPMRTGALIQTDARMSILGTDTLKHYCIQLDFASNKMRFLDPDRLNANGLGNAFPLTIFGDHVKADARILGVDNWVVDTGTPFDAVMDAGAFDRASSDQEAVPIAISKNTMPRFGACFPRAVLGGDTYTDLFVAKAPVGIPNIIGLSLLARNLVTFNFPKRVMYLKPVVEGPLNLGGVLTLEARTLLWSLAEKGQLPGLAKGDRDIHCEQEGEDTETYPASRTFKVQTGNCVDVTEKIKFFVSGNMRPIPAANEMAGSDPAPGIVKELRVEFRLGGRTQVAEAAEGEMLTLPEGAEILTALYGAILETNGDAIGENGETLTYHYLVVQESRGRPWKLQRAWLTGAKGRIVKEYHCS